MRNLSRSPSIRTTQGAGRANSTPCSEVPDQFIALPEIHPLAQRLAVADTLDLLAVTLDAEKLTESIMNSGVLPPKAIRDAAHIAVSTVHRVEYLMTWNCKHLANAQISKRIAVICLAAGYVMPTICTPEELLEKPNDEE